MKKNTEAVRTFGTLVAAGVVVWIIQSLLGALTDEGVLPKPANLLQFVLYNFNLRDFLMGALVAGWVVLHRSIKRIESRMDDVVRGNEKSEEHWEAFRASPDALPIVRQMAAYEAGTATKQHF